ncbi:MAG: radical SAM protein [Campylobacterota bacterium]|nr:radical SAM protein [Campylobacterota bacterium]
MHLTFGPIPSRRFGMSLGIDLSANTKQCNFDCLYCELAPAKTVGKQTYSSSVQDIVLQVKDSLIKHPNVDVITFTANGEPTLYPYLDELIDEIDKIKAEAKTLILSNGANIYDLNIQKTLSKIDIVKLSLDCISQKCFKKLDRVDSSVDCSKILQGILDFKASFSPTLVIEILFVQNMNNKTDEITKLVDALNQIQPNRLDIGTIDRPPAYDVQPLSFEELERIANQFSNQNVTIAYKERPKSHETYGKDEILTLLKRRPLTHEDIENTFDKNSKNILKNLVDTKQISTINKSGVEFYKFVE